MGDGSEKRKVELLNACPMFWCEYRLMAAARANRPKLTENDFWDLTHLATALPYANCVACDSPARHICNQVLRVEQRFGVTVIDNEGDLLDWLGSS